MNQSVLPHMSSRPCCCFCNESMVVVMVMVIVTMTIRGMVVVTCGARHGQRQPVCLIPANSGREQTCC